MASVEATSDCEEEAVVSHPDGAFDRFEDKQETRLPDLNSRGNGRDKGSFLPSHDHYKRLIRQVIKELATHVRADNRSSSDFGQQWPSKEQTQTLASLVQK